MLFLSIWLEFNTEKKQKQNYRNIAVRCISSIRSGTLINYTLRKVSGLQYSSEGFQQTYALNWAQSLCSNHLSGFFVLLCFNYSWFIILHILVSSIQHYDSVSIFLMIIHYTLLQDIIYNSLCNIVNPCCSSIFCIVVCISYLICSVSAPLSLNIRTGVNKALSQRQKSSVHPDIKQKGLYYAWDGVCQ